MIIRNNEDINKNIWGKRCSCGNIVYGFYEEHLFVEENINKEIVCLKCNKNNNIKKEEAREFYNKLIFECFKEVKGKVLEIGCGGGFLTTYLTNKKDVTSVLAVDNDMSNNEIKYINSLDNCKYKNIDLNNFCEEIFDEHFDYVVCKDVLMYLKDIDYTFNILSKISSKIVLLNWHSINHKNCLNKTGPNDVYEIINKYYNDIEITYPSFYKWGYLVKTIIK